MVLSATAWVVSSSITLPDYDLLFVTTADTQGLAGGNQLIYDALYDEILPFIQADPLPEDQKTHTELLSVLSSLAIAPLGDSAMTADGHFTSFGETIYVQTKQ